jgi:hypothetical protein
MNCAKREEAKGSKAIFGLEKGFFKELFIPKENTFHNSLFDLTVENNRFLSFPYFFEDKDAPKKRKEGKLLKRDIPACKSYIGCS